MKILTFIAGMAVFLAVFSAALVASAQAGEDEQAIEQVSSTLDDEARKLGGTKTVADHLKKQFHINDEVIYSLRDRKIGYGDINTVLAVAEQMPGGITKGNIEEVVNMRGGQAGNESWNKITNYLGVKMDSVAHRTKAVIFTLSSEEPSRPTDQVQAADHSGMLIKKF